MGSPAKEPTDLSISIVHSLPGRLRCRLSHLPGDWEAMRTAIEHHEGIRSLEFTPSTRSILLRHDPVLISREEFIIRLAVAMSHEHDAAPVRLIESPPRDEMSAFSFLAGMVLAGAALSGVIPGLARIRKTAEIAAGVGTALAVVQHGYSEVRETGSFDPEVLSVVYLLYALVQRRGLTASLVTWIASFGRHLLTPPFESVMLAVRRAPGGGPDNPAFDVSVNTDRQQPRLYGILKYVRSIIADALAGGNLGRDQLIGRIREVTRDHDSVLEGIGKLETGINIRFG